MITTCISYCSRDEKFIHKNISECLKFSDTVIISCVDHFFDGMPDTNLYSSLAMYMNDPKIKIIINPWDIKSDICGDGHYWHNVLRYAAFMHTKNKGYYLFLDADEIPNGDLFKKYLETSEYKNYDIVGDFMSYYFFREPIYRSRVVSGVGLLIKSEYIIPQFFFTPKERWFYRYVKSKSYEMFNLQIPKIIERISFNAKYPKLINFNGEITHRRVGDIMFNHYSWVKSKEEMLQKVNSWGHRLEKNWNQVVNDHFSKPFDGTCFVHGWQYDTVDNFLEIK